MILVVSCEHDAHANEVLRELEAHGAEAWLLDLGEFPSRGSLTIDVGEMFTDTALRVSDSGPLLRISDCGVIWWRRPQPFAIPDEISEPEARSFAAMECHAAFAGLWLTIDAFWINHPTRDLDASRKVYQLRVAQDLGFDVPETRITNSSEAAERFIERLRPQPTVYKAFTATEGAWRETRLLRSDELALLCNVRYAPVIFQEYIPAGIDLRITIVGQQIFTAAIYAHETEYPVDFRMSMDVARVEPFELPQRIANKLLAFMSRLGLIYGAIDMRMTPDGEFVFLEINTSGQWLFVEQRTRQPITTAMAQLMISMDA